MGIWKGAFSRYRIINECLTDKQKSYWTLDEMMDKIRTLDLAVDRRTLERDLGICVTRRHLAFLLQLATAGKTEATILIQLMRLKRERINFT